MTTEWLAYPVSVDGEFRSEGVSLNAEDPGYAKQVLEQIGHVVGTIEQAHGEGRLMPTDFMIRLDELEDRVKCGRLVDTAELTQLISDLGDYYELSPEFEKPRFVDRIDATSPRINVKETDIGAAVDAMIDNYRARTRAPEEPVWSQGTQLIFAFCVMSVFIIAVVAMAVWMTR